MDTSKIAHRERSCIILNFGSRICGNRKIWREFMLHILFYSTASI